MDDCHGFVTFNYSTPLSIISSLLLSVLTSHLTPIIARVTNSTVNIVDEMSMVGRKIFGQVDQRLRQTFPQCADQVLGGRSFLLFGDLGQLPPVMDLPFYKSVSRSALSDLGRSAYQSLNKAVVLTQVIRQQGQDPEQVRFRDILLRLGDASVTQDDWERLMTRRDGQVADKDSFEQALHLLPTVNAVAEHNLEKLRSNGKPVAEIKAVHRGPKAHIATSDDAGGLEPVIHVAYGARVMLTSNLWSREWSNGYSTGYLLSVGWTARFPSCSYSKF